MRTPVQIAAVAKAAACFTRRGNVVPHQVLAGVLVCGVQFGAICTVIPGVGIRVLCPVAIASSV